jgi:Predicted glycosyltransferases
MLVSVVICGYDMGRVEHLVACIESVMAQTHSPLEVVLVVDGHRRLHQELSERYGDEERLIITANEANEGISYSRTRGAEVASGAVVAFIDDDAVAMPEWIEQHVTMYADESVMGVAGPVEPRWVDSKPGFFPDEFYWLVGCTEPGFAAHGDRIRNGYGSNVSYRREAFLAVGGYDAKTGRRGEGHVQAHEAPVGIKLAREFDQPIVYTASARVEHSLFAYRGRFRWLVFRSFWQGYSKRLLDRLYAEDQVEERAFVWEYVDKVAARLPD